MLRLYVWTGSGRCHNIFCFIFAVINHECKSYSLMDFSFLPQIISKSSTQCITCIIKRVFISTYTKLLNSTITSKVVAEQVVVWFIGFRAGGVIEKLVFSKDQKQKSKSSSSEIVKSLQVMTSQYHSRLLHIGHPLFWGSNILRQCVNGRRGDRFSRCFKMR